MCGIFGLVRNSEAQHLIGETLKGLEGLSYRGYDSFGVGYINSLHGITVKKSLKLDDLRNDLISYPWPSYVKMTIGHCRWASTGNVSVKNAHPIQNGGSAVCHNGQVENFADLKKKYESYGAVFNTDTDTEIIAVVFNDVETFYRDKEGELDFGTNVTKLLYITREVNYFLEGSFAYVLVNDLYPNFVILTARKTPLYYTMNGYFSSDYNALRGKAETFKVVEDDEVVIMEYREDGVNVHEFKSDCSPKLSANLSFPKTPTTSLVKQTEEGSRMLAEIEEQVDLIKNFEPSSELLNKTQFVFLGCGSSYNVALCAARYFKDTGGYSTRVQYASEFDEFIDTRTYVAISQSGESYDVLNACRYIKEKMGNLVGVTNNINSSLGRLCDDVMSVECGPELAVAATKTYILSCLRLLSQTSYDGTLPCLDKLSEDIAKIINNKLAIQNLANRVKNYTNILVLGANYNYYSAREFALKMTEVAAIHSQGLVSSEIKHGPIVLVNPTTLCVFLLDKENNKQVFANIEQVKARDGYVIAIQPEGIEKTSADVTIELPSAPDCFGVSLQHLYNVVVGQLLAYYTAKARGLNADKPASLAKCSTVL